MIIEELVAILGYDIRGQAELQRFNAGLERTAAIASRVATALVAAGTIAAGAMAAFAKGVVNVSATFEGFETALTTIEGSSDKAKQSMDWIAKFAAKTPYELEGITNAFIKLKSYGIDPVDGTLETLGDTASAMNKPLNMAVEAFADATSFQFERLREFGVVASQKGDEVTFTWTKNGKSMSKTVKKTGAEVQKFLKEHWGKSFSGAMIRQSKTWNGMMSNLSDSWMMFQKRVGDAGFFPLIKSRLADLMDFLGRLDADGTLDRIAKTLSSGLEWGLDKAVGLIKGFAGDIKFLFDLVKGFDTGWMDPVIMGLKALALFVFPKTAGFFILLDALRWLQGKGSVISDLAKSLHELTGVDAAKLEKVIAALAVGLGAFMLFGGSIGTLAKGVRSLALALGLMGGAQAAAGTAAMASITGGGMIAGFLGLAAAVGAAAGAVKLFYDAWKADVPLNEAIKEKVGKPLLDIVGDAIDPNLAETEYWRSGQGDKDIAEQKKHENRVNAKIVGKTNDTTGTERIKPSGDLMDYKLQLAAEEEARLSGKKPVSVTANVPAVKAAPASDTGGALAKMWAALSSVNAHLSQMSAKAVDKAVNATISDNRQFPVSVSTVINQTVTTAVEGATAAANVVAGAVNKAAVPDKSRTNTFGHF